MSRSESEGTTPSPQSLRSDDGTPELDLRCAQVHDALSREGDHDGETERHLAGCEACRNYAQLLDTLRRFRTNAMGASPEADLDVLSARAIEGARKRARHRHRQQHRVQHLSHRLLGALAPLILFLSLHASGALGSAMPRVTPISSPCARLTHLSPSHPSREMLPQIGAPGRTVRGHPSAHPLSTTTTSIAALR